MKDSDISGDERNHHLLPREIHDPILNSALRIIALGGTAIISWTYARDPNFQIRDPLFWLIVTFQVLALWLALWKTGPSQLRAGFLSIYFNVIPILLLSYQGATPECVLMLTMGVLISGLLFGKRALIAAYSLSVLWVILIGWLWVLRILPPANGFDIQATNTPEYWIRASMAYAAGSGVIISFLWFTIRQVTTTHRGKELALQTLTIEQELRISADLARLQTQLEAQAAIRQSELELHSIFRTAPIGLSFVRNRTFININEEIERIFGRSKEELVGHSVRILYEDEKTFAQFGQILYSPPAQGNPVRLESKFRHKNGHLIDVVLHCTAINPDHLDAGFVVVCQDITRLNQAQDALRASENQYRGMFENALEGIFRLGPDGIYQSVNKAMARMRGYDSPEQMLVDKRHLNVESLPEEESDLLGLLATNGHLQNFETRVRHRDGTPLWILINARTVKDGDGNTLYYEGSNLDITEHKYIGELQEAKIQAEAAARAKSAFLANISHEIRTPMHAILGFAQLLLRDDSLSANQREQLRIIDQNGEFLLSLLNDILDLAKLEAHHVSLKLNACDVRRLTTDLISMFSAKARAKNLELILSINPSCPSPLLLDEGKLRQILINLLSNAIKFTARGHVRLSVDTEPLPDSQWALLIEVEDTGPGIKEDEIPKLFRYFEQTDLGRESMSGTGLGLAISREFARLMKGDITVTSEPKVVTRFRVTIPTIQELTPTPPWRPSGNPTMEQAPVCAVDRSTASFDSPPARGLIEALRKTCEEADPEAALLLIAQIRNTHPVLADKLDSCAVQFDWDNLQGLIQDEQLLSKS